MIRKPLTRVELRMDDVSEFEKLMKEKVQSSTAEEGQGSIEELKKTREGRAILRNERIGYTVPTETPTLAADAPPRR